MTDYLVLFLIWAVYLILHSVLASNRAKALFGLAPHHYRLLYSIISTIGLLYIGFLMATIPAYYFYQPTDFFKYLGMVTASWGVMLIVASFRQISLKAFLGLKSIQSTNLVTDGLHGYVRHPIYTGTILLMLGMVVAVPSSAVLTSTIAIFLYLPIGIYFEEKKLIQEFGQEYLDYKSAVKAIIPRVL
jgi:methanethiol S-methyltransferase